LPLGYWRHLRLAFCSVLQPAFIYVYIYVYWWDPGGSFSSHNFSCTWNYVLPPTPHTKLKSTYSICITSFQSTANEVSIMANKLCSARRRKRRWWVRRRSGNGNPVSSHCWHQINVSARRKMADVAKFMTPKDNSKVAKCPDGQVVWPPTPSAV